MRSLCDLRDLAEFSHTADDLPDPVVTPSFRLPITTSPVQTTEFVTLGFKRR
jgi:hypothetical protein